MLFLSKKQYSICNKLFSCGFHANEMHMRLRNLCVLFASSNQVLHFHLGDQQLFDMLLFILSHTKYTTLEVFLLYTNTY